MDWTFVRLNYYGRIYRSGEWLAIECFNFYYRPVGFSISCNREYVGFVKRLTEV